MNSKNAKKEKAKLQRVHFNMNLGERIHKDPLHMSRGDRKIADRRLIREEMSCCDDRDFK